ncbi:MAG TPA: glycoside hydrolase family 15 protein [Candidatus Binatia bacterium]|nr:glycoside hydrolase family 15 protein [Candidatus Binatia bacterium]
MGRPVLLSNGHILVGLNERGTVHDFYYPYIGLDNLTSARVLNHKIGVWVNGKFAWTDDDSWQFDIDFEEEALVSNITATNDKLGVQLHFNDFVDSRYPALLRRIEVRNKTGADAEIRLFMHQAFQISRAGRSDTALFIPEGNYILDYKGWASLLIYAHDQDGNPFDQFSVGNFGIEGKEGTFRDAEDGELSGGLVEHGGVDSVLRIRMDIPADGSHVCSYWVVASDSQGDAEKIHKTILQKGLEARLESTRQAFSEWLDKARPQVEKVDTHYRKMLKKSLLVVKAHIDNHGGVIASADSSIYNYGRDYYSYVWPRDGAYALLPLIELGYKEEPKKFFQFCIDVMDPAGYMKHKYQPDRALGSTWHPQLHLNHPELPIQEDETAIVIYALARYLEVSNDEDFVRSVYSTFVKPCADFMASFIDEQTNLPHGSYDLWEQIFATFTYSVYVTMAALKAAAGIAERFNKSEDQQNWLSAVARIKDGARLLVNPNSGAYRKSLFLHKDGNIDFSDVIDASSFYGAFLSGLADESTLNASVKKVEEVLMANPPIGGVPRYEHDDYFLADHTKLGNPWIITTLWLAQYYMSNDRLKEATDLIDWAIARATPSGMMAEQVDPNTGMGLGVLPLAWSHSTMAETLLMLSRLNKG